jgi:hypothetical protein
MARASKARNKAEKSVERARKLKEKNKRELERAKRDPQYKPKIKRRKRR